MTHRLLTINVTCPCCDGRRGWPEDDYGELDFGVSNKCDLCLTRGEVWFIVLLWWRFDIVRLYEDTPSWLTPFARLRWEWMLR